MTFIQAEKELKKIAERGQDRQIAQTQNEGVAAIKEKYGSYGGAVSKMKNFLRMSADKKDPTTGLEFQEHIPQKMFGVSSDEVATSLGMTENEFMDQLMSELGRTKKPVPSAVKEIGVSSEKLPIGTGEEKVSRLEARMKAAIDAMTPEQIKELGTTTYNEMNDATTIKEAAKFVTEKPKEALQVITGEIKPPPGLNWGSVYVAMTQIRDLNFEVATKVATLGATAIGQNMQILSMIDKNSPISIMNDIYKVKEQNFEKRYAGKTPKQVTEAAVKKGVAKMAPPKMVDWAGLIKEVRC